MTTSYELSLKLKELGAVQTNGEYYWVEGNFTGVMYLHHKSEARFGQFDYDNLHTVLCRAFTLGELVREFSHLELWTHNRKVWYAGDDNSLHAKKDTPEEAAGDLYCEILKQKA